jgi:CDP-diacylglycerol---glycerol-3-phosphate 3-phosphatidyltransferase
VFTDRARQATRGIIAPIVAVLARLGVTPNMLTGTGVLLHVVVAWLIATAHYPLGGAMLALAAAFDGLDGSLARHTGRVLRSGAFLDSSLDRVSEILVFFGLLVAAQNAGPAWSVWLVYAAATASLMVSYTRARSEALGAGTKAGVLGRLERMVVLVVGLLIGQVTLAVAIVALGAAITTVMRIVDGARRCNALES